VPEIPSTGSVEKDPMKVLIADDDPVSRRLLQMCLTKAGYETIVSVDGAEALAIVNGTECPRLMVLDWMMPHVDGVEICRVIRKLAQEPYIYVILLTARGRQEEIIEGLEAGADDYITKPFDLDELKARLRAGKRILDLQEQLVFAREQLRNQATHDSLTGLLNRPAILETLHREVSRSAREGTPVTVIMADLDHFKQINDTYGHVVGDDVLRESARRMLNAIRDYDSIGRYGGEEFLVIAPGCGAREATVQAERLCACVSAAPIDVAGHHILMTLSVGVAACTDRKQADDLLRIADEALYEAKNAGRNRVEVSNL
jgi:diguanylate cyclase (GGDEF)-like protein